VSTAGVDFSLADFDPGMGCQTAFLPGNAKTEPARDTASTQHRVCREGARKAKRVDAGFCRGRLNTPRDPVCLIASETINALWWTVGPGENTSRGDNTESEPRQDHHHGGFTQVHAPDRLQLHCAASGGIVRISCCSRSVLRKGVTSRATSSRSTP